MSLGMKTNIDGRGRLIRAASGVLFLLIAAVVLFRGLHVGGALLRWGVGLMAAAVGGFQVFEAVTGWCVVRALGGKTPL